MLDSDRNVGGKGRINSESGGECKLEETHEGDFCGYLEIQKNLVDYKLLIVHSDKKGELIIVRKDSNTITHYRNSVGRQLPQSSSLVDFEELTTFKNVDSGLGRAVMKSLIETAK